MDSNATAGAAGPGTAGPLSPPPAGPPPAAPAPADGDQPDHGAEVSALKTWFKENMISLAITAIVCGLIIVYLDPIDTLKVVIGLGLVIFIHELGHFVAAKWCDVHVKTFSIGFGPAIPFCSYKWGETTYKLAIIPLGGYVSMVGEGDNAGDDDAEEDPRSFRKKTVGQRMVIISAGVIMNVILGMACFVAAYLHGVQEKPATVGWVESGGAAWKAGMHTNDHIVKIDSREKPYFNDIRPIVMATHKDEPVELMVQRASGPTEKIIVYPLKDEGVRFPQVGIAPPYRLSLLSIKRKGFRPVVPGSPAAEAKEPGFEPGDRFLGMTDPDKPGEITPFRPDPKEPGRGPDINDYYERMRRLAGRPVTFRVARKDKVHGADVVVDVAVPPAYRADLGMRMRMGEVSALRVGGPAEQAGIRARTEAPAAPGDRITIIKLPETGGKQTWFAAGEVKPDLTHLKLEPLGLLRLPAGGFVPLVRTEPFVAVRKLDPLRMPVELKRWAERNPEKRKVKLVVLRTVGHKENDPVEFELAYDDSFHHDREVITLPNTPVPLTGLGLAYWVQAVVDEVEPKSPAGEAGLKRDDLIAQVRFQTLDFDGKIKEGDWEDVKPHQWASVDSAFQKAPPHKIELKVKRGDEEIVVSLDGRPDMDWPADDRGFIFQQDFRTQKAADVVDAMQLGAWRTVRFIKEVYMNLYAMIFGRVSAKTMSGPLTIANVSYRFAGEDFWQFLLFIGMISVNLAVVNFLPIPVLDGGHMVFLILEKILGRPVPERVFAFAMYLGLAMILSLMIFVLTLDVGRLFFGWL